MKNAKGDNMIKFLVISLIFVPIVILVCNLNPENLSVWMLVILFSKATIYTGWDYVKKRKNEKTQYI